MGKAGNEIVRYGWHFLTKNQITVGYLGGTRLKKETENGVFFLRFGKRFSLKAVKRYDYCLRCFSGNGRSRKGRVAIRVTNSDAL